MKKGNLQILAVAISLILVALLLATACAKPAPAPAPTPAPAPAPVPAGTIELKFAFDSPPKTSVTEKIYEPWAKKLEELTNGKVRITFYGGGALGKKPELYNVCLARGADIVWTDPNAAAGVFPRAECIGMPVFFESANAGSTIFWDLMQKYMSNTEFSKVKVLFVHTTGLNELFSSKQVQTLEDLKGMKLCSESKTKNAIIEALGGVAVFMSPADMYTAQERGMVEGRFIDWDGASVWKVPEVTKYRTSNIGVTTNTNVVLMNADSWKNLPPDIQKIFDEVNAEMSTFAGEVFDKQRDIAKQNIIDYDKKVGNPPVYYLTETEKDRWVKACQPVIDAWVSAKEAQGISAKAIIEDIYSLQKK